MNRICTAVLVAISASAAPTDGTLAQVLPDYRCVIERVEMASQDSDASQSFFQRFVGKDFTVERKTGVMAGALKNNYVTEPYVVDYGTNGNSFKVITTMRRDQGAGAGSKAYMLTVNEYVESERKPFLFAEDDVAFFGYCTHF